MAKDVDQRPIDTSHNPYSDDNAPNIAQHNTFINVRKLAALDIVFHGPKFILIEFGLGVFGCAALNYVPLLIYAISIVRHTSWHTKTSTQ